jgi:hypothetical protein
MVGALLLALSVSSVVPLAVRDTRTFDHGTRVPGTVTGLMQPRAWDPLDSGRSTVAEVLNGQKRTSRLWLDSELVDCTLGEGVTVIVRGKHVRTTDENNDPAPLGSLAFLPGPAWLALLVTGLIGLRGTATARPLSGDGVSLPSYFGKRRLDVPA